MATDHNRSSLYRRNRRAILSADHLCQICGLAACPFCGKLWSDSVDHIVPASKGGTHDLSNLRPAHKCCNSSRGDRYSTRYFEGYR